MVTDDYPTFIAQCHNARVPAKLDVPYYAVDSSCIVPMRHFEKREYAAYTIRPEDPQALAEVFAAAPAISVRRRFRTKPSDLHTTGDPLEYSRSWWHPARSITAFARRLNFAAARLKPTSVLARFLARQPASLCWFP